MVEKLGVAWLALTLLTVALFARPESRQNSSAKPSSPSLKLNLSTDKYRYKVGEPISITYSLENVTSESLYVHPLIVLGESVSGFFIDVFDEQGELTPRKGLEALFVGYEPDLDVVELVKRHSLLLHPQHFYGMRTKLPLEWYETLKKPGRYKLVATYYDEILDWLTEEQHQALKKLDHPIWHGKISSDPIWIEIVE